MEYIEFVEKVKQSIMEQLATGKKPGLVCPDGPSAHVDMDYPLMLRAVIVIHQQLLTMAYAGTMLASVPNDKAAQILQASGAAAEKELLDACNGRNALKGTFFATSLFAACYFRLQAKGEQITQKSLSAEIAAIAMHLKAAKDTNGAVVRETFDVGGALDSAKAGYNVVFDIALPMYRDLMNKGERKSEINRKVLLKLIATIDDTCLYKRQCSLVDNAKKIAAWVLDNYSDENIDAMCSYFARTSLSTGGAGDLLILTILAYKIFG